MGNVFGKMLQHPIASVMVIGATGSAVAGIIEAVKKSK